jgi:hypothetical protein
VQLLAVRVYFGDFHFPYFHNTQHTRRRRRNESREKYSFVRSRPAGLAVATALDKKK